MPPDAEAIHDIQVEYFPHESLVFVSNGFLKRYAAFHKNVH